MPLQTASKDRGPRPLKRMALTVAIRNVAAVTSLGTMPFADAKPILLHVDSPHQLHLLEANCPQLADEPDEMAAVWSRLLSKKMPGWETKGYLSPDDLATMAWIDIYTAVKEAADRDTAAATDRLQQALGGFTKAKEANAAQLINGRALLHKLPGASKHRRGPGGGIGGSSVLSFGAGSRTKMTSGQSVLRRARREAREISAKVSHLSQPTAAASAAAGQASAARARSQIRRPPAAMMNDHRVAHNPEIRVVAIRPPKARSFSGAALPASASTAPGTGLGSGNTAYEARLLAIKTGAAVTSPSKRPSEAASTGASPRTTVSPRKTRLPPRVQAGEEAAKKPRKALEDAADLFGNDSSDEVPARKAPKRPRLTVEDLEDLQSHDGGYGSRDATSPPKRRQPAASASKPTESEFAGPSASAGSPTRPGPAGAVPGRKKAVDIFFRPKKR